MVSSSLLYLFNLKNVMLLLSCLLFVSITVSSSASKSPLCRDNESSALLQFKRSFLLRNNASVDPIAYPKTASWKPERSSDCCSWDGVECDNATGHVIELDLSSSFLYGSINSSSSLFRLVRLQKLNLADNHFNFSQIPSAIQRLSRLTYLDLSNSVFYGQIPSEISKLSMLESLNLSLNVDLYSRSLNSLLQNFTNLKELSLTKVNISAPVPGILANLSSLTSLLLRDCELQGEFPAAIFQLPNLESLSVRFNPNLTGHLPEFNKSRPLVLLKVANTSFHGELPDSIGNLHFLNSLDLRRCNFSGSVPSSLGNLTQLEFLDLSFNTLNGQIPSSFQNLTRLSVLYLENNHLTGQIPSWLGNLTRLTILKLNVNKFHGSIPQSFSNLVNLETLYLNDNNLSGTVELDLFLSLPSLTGIQVGPNSLSLLIRTSVNATSPRFETVSFSGCNLTEFPDFLRYQHKLQWLDLSDNNIQGPVPKWLFNIGKDTLIYLSLANNSLTGSFGQPSVVLPWTSLRILNLASNMLQGPLPIPQPSIFYYSVKDNSMTGEILPLICNLSSLVSLELDFNNLSGTIPQCLGYFSSSLSILTLNNNKFHGAIPQMCSVGSNLRMMDLSDNQLQGPVPRSLANCTMLEILNLGSNQVNDAFPSWMGALQTLKILLLRSNQFHGKLPSVYIQNWHAMKRLLNEEKFGYLETNTSFSAPGGTTTGSYSYTMIVTNKGLEMAYDRIPEIFTAIDLSSNKFEGSIPKSIGNLQQLQLLNLSNNILTGRIPSSLGNLTKLESLDLSQNKLIGEIPNELTDLTFLAVLNLSHNHLTGPIPRGNQFNNFENSSFQGNPGLCGDPMSKKCGNSETRPPPLPLSNPDDGEDSNFPSGYDWIFILAGYGSGLVVGLVIGLTLTKRKHEWFLETFGRMQWKKQSQRARRQRN